MDPNQQPSPAPSPVTPPPAAPPEPTAQPVHSQPSPTAQPVGHGQPVQQLSPSPKLHFSSNPFTSLGKGLGTLLSSNPLAGVFVNLYFLLAVIPFFVVLFMGPLAGDNPAVYLVLTLLLGVISGVIMLKVLLAIYYIFKKSQVGEKTTVQEAFSVGSKGKIVSFLVLSIISGAIVFAGLILFIIPGLYLLARISLAPFAFYNEEIGPTKAISQSFKLTKGHVFEMWSVLILGGLGGGDGLIAPIMTSAPLANRYYELKEHVDAGQETGKASGWNYVIVLLPVLLVVGFTVLVIAVGSIN